MAKKKISVVTNPRSDRQKIISEIESIRSSRLITYVTSDRQGSPGGQIGSDAIRPIYDHLREIGFEGTEKIDLFIYSRGGGVEVPWPLVNMIREYCENFAVLVPFRAHSAATMIAISADEILMGKKGELGPIDPQLRRIKEGQQEVWSSEDVLSYLSFMKERAGLSDQNALSKSMSVLADRVGPLQLGNIYRTHSHIRVAARKLLSLHTKPLEERKVENIIETLCEKIYFHGHAIARKEAEEIGLPISEPNQELDDLMWNLYLGYEKMIELNAPIHSETIIPDDQEEESIGIILAAIESLNKLEVYRGDLKFIRDRSMPQNLQLNLNIPLQIPGTAPGQIPPQLQTILQQVLQQFRADIHQVVMDAIKQQAPVKGIKGSLLNASWQDVTNEGI